MGVTEKLDKKKAIDKASQGVDFATNNAVPIFKLVGAGIAVWLGYRAIAGLSNAIKDFAGDPNAGGGNPSTTGGTTVPSGATITTNLAATKAAALFNAMRYPGTDVQKILNTLNGMRSIDFAMISQEFGKPKYATIGGVYAPIGLWPALNLTEWLHEELNENSLQRLRQVMPGVI